MKLMFRFLSGVAAVALLWVGAARAATTTVAPSTGTLQAAIDAATADDILELQTGDYLGAVNTKLL